MFPKKIHLLLILLAVHINIYAQTIDSLYIKLDLGLQAIQDERYVDAFGNLKYYIDNAPTEEKETTDYTHAAVNYRKAIGEINEKRKVCYKEAVKAKERGQQNQLDSLCEDYLRLCVQNDSKKTFEYTFALTQHAMKRHRKGDTNECLLCLNKVLEIRHSSHLIDSIHMGETLNLIASIEGQRGNYNKAIHLCTRALNLYENRYGKKGLYYGKTLVNAANYYALRNEPGDINRAIELNELAVKILSKKEPSYMQALNKLSVLYSSSNEPSKARKYTTKVSQTKNGNKNDLNHASYLSNEAINMANSNNFPQALELANKAIDIFKAHGDTASLNYARLLANTAQFEKHLERYKPAISLWNRAVTIFENIEGSKSVNYISCMSEISAAYTHIGDLNKATDIDEILQDAVSSQALKANRNYAYTLMHQAANMAEDGNYHQATLLQQKALSIFRTRHETTDEAYALNELSNYLYHTGKLQEAIDSCSKALSLYEQIPDEKEKYALTLNNLSIYYYEAKRFDDALSASKKAITLFDKYDLPHSSFYTKILTNQSLFEATRDSLDIAIYLSTVADSIQRELLGEIHPDNVVLRFNLANYFLESNKTDEAQRFFHDALTTQMLHVRNNFSHFSSRTREQYWNAKNYIFHSAPYMACRMEDNDSAQVDAYNALLFAKGLLLNSEIDFNNLLANASNPKLQEKHKAFRELHNEMEGIWRHSTKESKERLPKLIAELNHLERELMKDSKEFGDFTESMTISYPQIAKALQKDEVAIEFFNIETNSGDQIYWALLAHNGMKAPRLIRLFSDRELNKFQFHNIPLTKALNEEKFIGEILQDPLIGELVWGKIIAELDDIKTIWFAPSGLFYQWGIEYLQYAGRRINDHYTIHRVSSTKMILHRDKQLANSSKRAAIFGGLDYEATAQELLTANTQIPKRLAEMSRDYVQEYASRFAVDSIDIAMAEARTMNAFARDGRGKVGYLAGTDHEADQIGECLMMNDIQSEMYKDVNGTEEAFKALSGRGISILHVATHGFSLSAEHVSQHPDALTYLNISGNSVAESDNSLCLSGLLLSGANNVLSGKALPEGMENGVLTAHEIAKLDLRGLDLAVLSACQTGIGQLKEDGVFGIQRGFKKAGARTLLMSLWEIDDTATQILMVEFYRALLNGNSPTRALHHAQDILRSNPKYSSPFYWASFIILDDIS